MNANQIIGVVLIVLGALALSFGYFSYNKKEEVMDLGPMKATIETTERVPISPVVGGLLIAGGIVLLLLPRRK